MAPLQRIPARSRAAAKAKSTRVLVGVPADASKVAKRKARYRKSSAGAESRRRERRRALRVSPSGRVVEGAVYSVLTRDEWRALYRGQGGRCVLCDATLRDRYDPQGAGKQASLDHGHHACAELVKAGVSPLEAVRRSVRGLLCSYPCNAKVLPFLRDCPNLARVAAEYLDAGPITLGALAS
jgi:hypothetical protein